MSVTLNFSTSAPFPSLLAWCTAWKSRRVRITLPSTCCRCWPKRCSTKEGSQAKPKRRTGGSSRSICPAWFPALFDRLFVVGTGESLLCVCLLFFASWDSVRKRSKTETLKRSTAWLVSGWRRFCPPCLLFNCLNHFCTCVSRLPSDLNRHGCNRENRQPVKGGEGLYLYSVVSHHQLVQRGNCGCKSDRLYWFSPFNELRLPSAAFYRSSIHSVSKKIST